MKYYTILLLSILCNFAEVKAQDYLNEDFLDGISYNWVLFGVDEFRFNDSIQANDGVSHLKLVKSLIVEEQNEMFLVYQDNSNKYQGGYIEKRNLNDAGLVWKTAFNLDNSDAREYIREAIVNTDGNLEIISFRNNDPNFIGSFYIKAKLAVREYNGETGELVKYSTSADDPNSPEIGFFFEKSNFAMPYKHGYAFLVYKHPELLVQRYDDSLIYLTTDTVSFFSTYPNYTEPNFHLNNDELYVTLHRLNQDNFDNTSTQVYSFDDEINLVDSIELNNNLVYNWRVGLSKITNNKKSFICKDSTDLFGSTERTSGAVLVLEGSSVIESIDLDKIGKKLVSSYNMESSTLVSLSEKHKLSTDTVQSIWNLGVSDGQGNLTWYDSLSILDKKEYNLTDIVHTTESEDVIIMFTSVEKGDDYLPVHQIHGLISVPLTSFLEVSTIDVSKELDYLVYPNPVSDNIFIKNMTGGENIKIYSLNGQLMLEKAYWEEKGIDISSLNHGQYVLTYFTSSTNKQISQVFIKD